MSQGRPETRLVRGRDIFISKGISFGFSFPWVCGGWGLDATEIRVLCTYFNRESGGASKTAPGESAKVLAGGQSLLPLLKLRLAEPGVLVDINLIPDLAYIREDGDYLRIGAVTRVNDLNDSDVIQSRYPILYDASVVISDPLVRDMGTVGGNLSHGDPANDVPACMMALGAQFGVAGPDESSTKALLEAVRTQARRGIMCFRFQRVSGHRLPY